MLQNPKARKHLIKPTVKNDVALSEEESKKVSSVTDDYLKKLRAEKENGK